MNSPYVQLTRALRALAATLVALVGAHEDQASAEAPRLLHAADYESPVRGDPDDLLLIGGFGFHATDHVVYTAADAPTSSPAHPATVPTRSSADAGSASIIQQKSASFGIVVRLPDVIRKGRPYRLWVVTEHNEWSVPVTINDPRPQWVSPGYAYATRDFAGLGRTIRVVGRNLAVDSEPPTKIRLSGPDTYVLTANYDGSAALRAYVAEAALPAALAPGRYTVSVLRVGFGWTRLPEQMFEIRPDPAQQPTFSLGDPRYGDCRPDDGRDDSQCFTRAIEAATHSGGGTVLVPPGTWYLTTDGLAPATAADGFILPRGVSLRGSGPQASFIVRRGAPGRRHPDPLLALAGHNTVADLSFTDEARFHSESEARSVIQLGVTTAAAAVAGASDQVEEIVVTDNVFRRVGRGITEFVGYPIARLFVTHNEFGAYADGIQLPGDPSRFAEPFRIDNSIVRWNRFIPGSYLDIVAHQGPIASGMGAANRVDFSSNVADGTATDALQDPEDPRGFRAAFFWNMAGNVEQLLAADNRISCSGDKAGDGEAFAFDESGDTYGFRGAQPVSAAGPDWVTVHGPLLTQYWGKPLPPETYYVGHWVQIAAGPGLGQTRKIVSYVVDPSQSSVTFRVAPRWDVLPGSEAGRVIVGRQYWQVFVVTNHIEHRSPPCGKSNLNGPHGGSIAMWAPSADSSIEANRQQDANGILFGQHYSVPTASCPECGNGAFFQTALEIRGNTVEGEYAWSSDCSASGISGSFGASRAPESPPPTLGFGVAISHNRISAADGQGGGAIDMAMTSYPGPPPGDWSFEEQLLIFRNTLTDITGEAPRAICGYGQHSRSGIRLGGRDNVRDTVLYSNRCERVTTRLDDGGRDTQRVCPPDMDTKDSCECPTR
jgi:hypothetical protein